MRHSQHSERDAPHPMLFFSRRVNVDEPLSREMTPRGTGRSKVLVDAGHMLHVYVSWLANGIRDDEESLLRIESQPVIAKV